MRALTYRGVSSAPAMVATRCSAALESRMPRDRLPHRFTATSTTTTGFRSTSPRRSSMPTRRRARRPRPGRPLAHGGERLRQVDRSVVQSSTDDRASTTDRPDGLEVVKIGDPAGGDHLGVGPKCAGGTTGVCLVRVPSLWPQFDLPRIGARLWIRLFVPGWVRSQLRSCPDDQALSRPRRAGRR
jgi:hypothetical protein